MDTMHTTENSSTGTPRTVADVLDATADYLARHGWCRESLYQFGDTDGENPRACALGAIRIAAYGYPVDDEMFRTDHGNVAVSRSVVGYLADYLDDGRWPFDAVAGDIVGDWNDSRSNADSVIGVLRAAARAYRSERVA